MTSHDREMLARSLVAERMAYYGYTPEQIEAASMTVDHYAAGCSLDGGFGWDCLDENGKSFHPDSDEYDATAEWVVWVIDSPLLAARLADLEAKLAAARSALAAVREVREANR